MAKEYGLNPNQSILMKAIYAGNYDGMMDMLRRLCNTQTDVMNLFSMNR